MANTKPFISLDLQLPRGFVDALADPKSNLLNLAQEVLIKVDSEVLFGPGKHLDSVVKQGAYGGGPHGWRPLTERYRRWKELMMRKGSFSSDLAKGIRQIMADKSMRVSDRQKAAAPLKRAAAAAEVRHFQTASKIRFDKKTGDLKRAGKIWSEPPPWAVISTGVWVRTGKVLNGVVRVTNDKGMGSGRWRRLKLWRSGTVQHSTVQISDAISYWKYAEDKRPLFVFDATAERLARESAQQTTRDFISRMTKGPLKRVK